MGQMNPFLVQDHFRIRDDNTAADPGTPNWITTEDQGTAEVINTATMFRIRFVISNTGAANATSNFDLYVSKNSGSYAAVTTTSNNVQAVDAGDSSSADATALSTGNFQLTAGTGTAAAGEYDEDGSVGANLSNGNYFEVEYCVSIVYADVADADTLDFRVYYNGAAMDSYSVTPRVEVNKTAAFLTQAYTRIRSDANSPDGGTPTWETTENQTGALSWNTNTDFRIRLVLENTGGVEEANQFNLYVSKNSGAYANITTSSSNVQAKDVVGGGSIRFETSNYLLTAGAGHPLPGWYSATNQLNRDIAGNEYVEYDIGLTIVDADVAHADTLDFRVYYNGSALDQYDHTPRISVVKASSQTVNIPLLSNTNTLYAFTVGLSYAVTMPLHTNTNTLYAFTVQWDQPVTVPLLTNNNTLYAFDVLPRYNVNVPLLSNTNTLYAFTVANRYDVNVPLYTNTNTLYAFSVTSTQTVNVPLLTNNNTLYAFNALAKYAVNIPLLTNANSLYAFGVTERYPVNIPLHTNTNTFYAFSVTSTQSVSIPLLSNNNTLYAFNALSVYLANIPLLTNTNSLYAFSVAERYPVNIPLLTNNNTLYSFSVQTRIGVNIPLHTNTQTFYSFTLREYLPVNVPLLSNSNVLHPFTLVQGYVVNMPLLVNTNNLYPFTVTQAGAPPSSGGALPPIRRRRRRNKHA